MTDPNTTTAFIAGATGYTGREVVRVLRARGVRTVAHVRPDSPRLGEYRARFEALGAEVDATPWDESAMRATFEKLQPTVIFALLGTTKKRGSLAKAAGRDEAQESYEAVDYGLSAMLLRAALQAGIKPRIVYLSSLGVSDSARGGYLQARARLERELRASGLPYTIARPSFITGEDREDDRPLERISAKVGDALLGVAAKLGSAGKRAHDKYAAMDAATLAEGLVRWGLDPAGVGRVVEAEELR